jgi:hypothetical protein
MPHVVDRALAKLQDPAYRPARPPHALPPVPIGGRVGVGREGTLSVLLRGFQYFSTFDGPETARSIDLARWGWLWWLAITEDCPPGEGMALEIDKIFWETKQAP